MALSNECIGEKMPKNNPPGGAKPGQPDIATFRALDVAFDWTNEKWASTFLLHIRLAHLAVRRDDKALEEILAQHINDGVLEELLKGWSDTAEHLEGIIKLLNSAIARSSAVLERMGYSVK
jgi:hypothetical protein